jgi:uncharacterized protein YuzB (UPF0349 family)
MAEQPKPKIQAKSTEEVREDLKNDEGIRKLYKYCENIFGILDKIHFAIKNREVIDGNTVDEKLDKLLGYRGFLAPINEAFEADMDGNANVFYINRKHEIESKGEKFTSAPADREAEFSVQHLRVLRNQLRGYINQIDIDIMVLQSKLKYYSERAKLER